MVGLSDANILGTGNSLKVMTNFSRNDFSYGGNMVEYEIPKRTGDLLHRKFQCPDAVSTVSTLDLGLRKEFIRPTDYEIGLTYNDIKDKRYMIEQDTSLLVKERNLDALGRLFAFPAENRVQHLPHGTVQLQPRQPTAPRSDPATTPHSTIRMPCSWVWDFTAKSSTPPT